MPTDALLTLGMLKLTSLIFAERGDDRPRESEGGEGGRNYGISTRTAAKRGLARRCRAGVLCWRVLNVAREIRRWARDRRRLWQPLDGDRPRGSESGN